MKTLDRYILSSMVGPFAVLLGACVVALVGHELWRYTEDIVQKQIPFDVVLRFVLFNVPRATLFALPAATVVGAAWALGRLSQSNELVPVRAGGISRGRVLLPTVLGGFVASLLSFAVSELLVPWANNASENLARNIVLGRRAFALAQGRFLQAAPDTFVYVLESGVAQPRAAAGGEGVEGYGILAFQQAGRPEPWLITAPSASFDGKTLTLRQPSTYIADASGLWVQSGPANASSTMRIDVAEITRQYWSRRTGVQDMSLGELLAERKRLREHAALGIARYDVQIHAAFALPLSCVAVTFLVGVVVLRFAGAMYSAILAAVFLLFAYYFGMLWLNIAGTSGAVAPAVAVWSENVAYVAAGLILLRRR
jgi:lipopolysaccharide export system permease protein